MTTAVEVADRPLCPHSIWNGRPGTDPYHPFCASPTLCQAQGCFWQMPPTGPSKRQRGFDL